MLGHRIPRVLAIVSALIATASEAGASVVVDLNAPTASLDIPGLSPVVTARYRFSRAGSADQLLYKQPNPAGYPSADPLALASPFVASSTYDFVVKHAASTSTTGGKFEFSLLNGSLTGNVTYREQGANSTISKTFGTTAGVSELNYNILHIFAVARTANSSLSFSNLAFTAGAGLTTAGALQTSGSVANGTHDQWIAAATGVNLDEYDWTFSGRVTLTVNGTNPSSGELIKFELTGKSGAYASVAAVPEPATVASGLLGLVAAGWAGLKRTRRV